MPATTYLASRRWIGGVALAALGLIAGACGGDDGDVAAPTSTTTTTSDSGGNVVEIELVAFKPERITIAAGDTVVWKQNDAGAHTVTSGTVEQGGAGVTQQPDQRFDSGDIPTGKSFEFSFPEPGTYPYFCRLHPATMRGEVEVR
ncbi:MAG TPA: cupredoxin family copper-binding protein [Acidimicrobiales bacterium]|nr:cupredoxin family copper-binding protein [Acidimicrobiales bacterium]